MAIINGSVFNDALNTTIGNDSVSAFSGNDYVYGGIGDDNVNGGAGIDTMDYSLMNGGITLGAGGFINKGLAGFDSLSSVENIVGNANFINAIDASSGDSGQTSMTVDLSQNSLIVNNIPVLGSLNFGVFNFTNVTGTTQGDSISGDLQNNVLDGWEGNDFLFGDGGDDLLLGWTGDDVLSGWTGNDTMEGEAGNDTFIGYTGNDVMLGGTGIDTVDYSFLNQGIILGAGGSLSKGLAGVDSLVSVENIISNANFINAIDASSGDSGQTSLTVDLSQNSLTVNNVPVLGTLNFGVVNFLNVTGTTQGDSISGDLQNNVLNGWEGSDFLFGDGGNDLLLGWTGNDVLNGWTGNDTMEGGAGNDTFIGYTGNDVMLGGTGIDTADYSFLDQGITLGAGGSLNKGLAGVDSLVSVENIIGNANFINAIDASSGDSGQTSLTVDLSQNSLTVNNVPVLGTLNFGVVNFLNVTGTTQGDSISGDLQNNVLDGWEGNDFLFGDGGNDLLLGWTGNDTLDGWTGNDTLQGEAGNDTLMGYTGNDVLLGGTGSDMLMGEVGNDVLNGYGGTLGEFDLLSGGSGADLFALGDAASVFYQGSGYATITDFNFAEGDKIQVLGSANNYSLSFQNFLGGFGLDTLIFFGADLIGVVQDNTDVVPAFDFVAA